MSVHAVKVTDSRSPQRKVQQEGDVFLTSWGYAKPKHYLEQCRKLAGPWILDINSLTPISSFDIVCPHHLHFNRAHLFKYFPFSQACTSII